MEKPFESRYKIENKIAIEDLAFPPIRRTKERSGSRVDRTLGVGFISAIQKEDPKNVKSRIPNFPVLLHGADRGALAQGKGGQGIPPLERCRYIKRSEAFY